MSIKKFSMMLLSAVAFAALLNGCGSSSKESAISAGNVARVGDTSCFQCHASTADPLTGETFITQYQRSLHANLGCESCHGGGAQHNGIGPFPYELNSKLSDAQKAQRCAMCHNGTDAPLSSSANFQNGNHANPFSAEEAHEAKCARCHSHEGAILYGKDGFTGDKSIIDNTAFQPVLARDPETFNTIKCATCHEHGGNIRQTKTRDLAGNVVTWDPNNNKVTDQFDVCTSCHTMTTNAGRQIGSGNILAIANTAGLFTNVTTAAYYHNTAWYRTLPSTHVDQAASGTTATGTVIEGYVVRKNTKNPCFDCHGHEFQTNTRSIHPQASAAVKSRPNTIYLDWAQSAHAGKLLTQKITAAAGATDRTTAQVDAVMKAGVTDTSGPGWSHYDWDASNRAACQRCHTTTGISNFLSSPTKLAANGSYISGYDPSQAFRPTSSARNARLNNFGHLDKWSRSNTGVVTSSGQNELLYCYGCHSNAGTGKLRDPGALTIYYGSGATMSSYTYPDLKGSNVCIGCHTGRETGDTIKLDTDADGTRGFINSHYLTAGGTLFATTGYEFAGQSYANPSFFKHDIVGTATAPGTGSNGPCAGCHMTSSNGHKFLPVTKDNTGAITAITSTSCVTCHTGGSALTPASLTTEEEEYKAALEGLKASLAAKGIHFGEANPYFYTAPYVAGGANTTYTTWAANYGFASYKDVMGAAFNANLLIHDPGGYAHNRFYAKRLIWDSIDFIDDGILNNSVPATLAARLTGLTLTEAQAYLGSARP